MGDAAFRGTCAVVRVALIALVIGLFWVALSLVLSASPASATESRSGLLGDVTDTLEDTAEETLGAVDAVVAPVVEPVKPVVESVVKPVQAAAEPVQAVTKPVVTEVVEPVTKPIVREVVQPVADVVDGAVNGTGDVVFGVTDGASELLDGVLPLDPITDPVAELPADLGGVLDGVLDETGDVVAELPGEVVELPGAVVDLPGTVVDLPGAVIDGPSVQPAPGVVSPALDGRESDAELPASAVASAILPSAQAPLALSAPFRAGTVVVASGTTAGPSFATLADRLVQAPAGLASGGLAGGDATDASADSAAASGAPAAVTGDAAALRLLTGVGSVVTDDQLPTVPTFESDATPD